MGSDVHRTFATTAFLLFSVGCGDRAAPPATAPASSRGKVEAFSSIAAASGKVDKVGPRDGAFTPDGLNDLVFGAVLDGPATAIVIVSVDASGVANGAFYADTYVGEQVPPLEVSGDVKLGRESFGIGVYEGDVLLNAKDGSLPMLTAGRHELTLHVSTGEPPKGRFRAYAVFDDRSVAASPIAR